MHYVSVTAPGDDCDGGMLCKFPDQKSAIAFAVDCAKRIDLDDWINCSDEADGDEYDALTAFNENLRFANDTGLMGHYVIAVSREYSRSYVLAACEG